MSETIIPVRWMTLFNVHEEVECEGRPCVIHRPSLHHMRHWPLIWRYDRKIFERLCPHDVGHPDPDQYEYWDETNQLYQSMHGCCGFGCCKEWEGEEWQSV